MAEYKSSAVARCLPPLPSLSQEASLFRLTVLALCFDDRGALLVTSSDLRTGPFNNRGRCCRPTPPSPSPAEHDSVSSSRPHFVPPHGDVTYGSGTRETGPSLPEVNPSADGLGGRVGFAIRRL